MNKENGETNIESEETKSFIKENTIYKKPDNVADFPNLIPYPTNVGAPQIVPDNVDFWKQKNLIKLNKHYSTEFQELKQKYESLISNFKWNELIYNSKFNFEPVMGEIYFLYQKTNGELFLSLICPDEWDFELVGSFKLTSTNRWEKI
jgi:hypothetical protein